MKHIWLPDNHYTSGYRSPVHIQGWPWAPLSYAFSAAHVRQDSTAAHLYCIVSGSPAVCWLSTLLLCTQELCAGSSQQAFFIQIPCGSISLYSFSRPSLHSSAVLGEYELEFPKIPAQPTVGCLVPCLSVQVMIISVIPHPVKPRGRHRLCFCKDNPGSTWLVCGHKQPVPYDLIWLFSSVPVKWDIRSSH